jgi:hypothetical protein
MRELKYKTTGGNDKEPKYFIDKDKALNFAMTNSYMNICRLFENETLVAVYSNGLLLDLSMYIKYNNIGE